MVTIKITLTNEDNNLFESFKLKKNEPYYDYMKRLVQNGYRLNFNTKDATLIQSAKRLVSDGVIKESELEIVS